MNRRIRIRTYGGVGGGVPQGPLLPDPQGRRVALLPLHQDQAAKIEHYDGGAKPLPSRGAEAKGADAPAR